MGETVYVYDVFRHGKTAFGISERNQLVRITQDVMSSEVPFALRQTIEVLVENGNATSAEPGEIMSLAEIRKMFIFETVEVQEVMQDTHPRRKNGMHKIVTRSIMNGNEIGLYPTSIGGEIDTRYQQKGTQILCLPITYSRKNGDREVIAAFPEIIIPRA